MRDSTEMNMPKIYEDVTNVEFGDPSLMKWVPGEDGQECMTYCRCPLCGGHGAIYSGNAWGTTPCCFHDGNWLERLTAGRLLAGDSEQEVLKLILLLQSRAIPSYVTYIASLVKPGVYTAVTCASYKAYLERTMPSDEQGTRLTACILHQDGTLSVVERGETRMSYISYRAAEVDIIRKAILATDIGLQDEAASIGENGTQSQSSRESVNECERSSALDVTDSSVSSSV